MFLWRRSLRRKNNVISKKATATPYIGNLRLPPSSTLPLYSLSLSIRNSLDTFVSLIQGEQISA